VTLSNTHRARTLVIAAMNINQDPDVQEILHMAVCLLPNDTWLKEPTVEEE
jgi:hypothetical protein